MTTEAARVVELCFCECEHSGDLSAYAEDVRKAGGVVKGQWLDEHEDETGWVKVEVADWNGFRQALRATDSANFCTGFRRSQ